MHMMYASSKTHLVQKLDVAGKVRPAAAVDPPVGSEPWAESMRGVVFRMIPQMMDVRRQEELTEEFLQSKLAFYK